VVLGKRSKAQALYTHIHTRPFVVLYVFGSADAKTSSFVVALSVQVKAVPAKSSRYASGRGS
jgi:hypothetical protein